jgi:lysophospholipase L1-like esterase
MLLILLCIVGLAVALPLPLLQGKPIAFVLAGDSTTAKGGGWGNGFISNLEKPNIGTNYGHNGATTVSFKKGGDWSKVMADVKKHTGQYSVYVTIQVGRPPPSIMESIMVLTVH